MDYARTELADALAAQYVAGTLRGPARRRFEALLAGHPALRSAVAAWQDRLIPLTAVVEPVPPPPQVWRAIEGRLWPDRQAAAAVPWWQRLALWRTISGLAAVAAIALAFVVVNPAIEPPVVIVLQGTGAGSAGTFVASMSGDGRAMVTKPLQAVSLQANKSLELWAVPTNGTPRSLGLISSNGTTLIPREKLSSALKGDTRALAVTLEPPGGSPVPGPTGPVLWAGKLTS